MALSGLVLFSGGIDSTTTLAIAVSECNAVIALSFDYGQRHRIELQKSAEVLKQFPGIKQIVFQINLQQVGGSALTAPVEVPKFRKEAAESIPITYVPGRNLIFLSIAAAIAEVHSATEIYYGANILDYSGYPDCRPEFINALEAAMNLGTKSGVEGRTFHIHAPLLQMSKSEIIQKGIELKVDYRFTHSCYDPDPDGRACGACDSCLIRLKGFAEAGLEDPAVYQKK